MPAKISVSIIMKNEEPVLARCLECVSKFADEVVVVDTGSTDKSKEIAASFPKVKLFDSEFFNKDTHFSDFEFGKAKNEAIKHCTGDWIFWMDCDDFMDDENIAKVVKLANEETRTCLFGFQIVYGSLRFEHCRMFKNGDGILFDENHACHEYINTLGFPLIQRLDIAIQHLPGQKSIGSHSRNLAIMEKDYYVRKREDQRTLFYLANSYREAQQFDKAVEFYDKYLGISKWNEERFFARYYKAQTLWRQGKLDEARNEALKAMTEDTRFAEPYCFMGDVSMAYGDFEKAILWYKMAMTIPLPKDAKLFVSEDSYSKYPTMRIGECMKALGATGESPSIESQKKVAETPKTELSVVKRKEKFSLPEKRDLAMLAIQSLLSCTGQAEITLVTTNTWQKAIARHFGFSLSQGSAKALSLPPNLKGKHATEWFMKSAGFVGLPVKPVDCKSTSQDKKFVVTNGNELAEKISSIVKAHGKEISQLSDDAHFEDALSLLSKSSVFVGKEGWLQHLAEWVGVPSFILFNGRNSTEFGWSDQQNKANGDFEGLEEFIERSLKV